MIYKKMILALCLVLGIFGTAHASLGASATTLTGTRSNPLLFYASGLPASGTVNSPNYSGVTESVTVTRTGITLSFWFYPSSGPGFAVNCTSFYGGGTMPYTYIARSAFPSGAGSYTIFYTSMTASYSGTCSDGKPVSLTERIFVYPSLITVSVDDYKFTQNKITQTIIGSVSF